MSDTFPDASASKPDPATNESQAGPDAKARPSFASMVQINPAEWWAAIIRAFALLTRLAALPPERATDEGFLLSMRAFPLIGALIGAIGGLVYVTANAINLAPLVSVSLAMGAMLIVSRPPHAEALAALLGGVTDSAEAKQQAMAPSGLIALILVVVVELGVLAQVGALSPPLLLLVLMAAGALSRAVAVAALDWSTQQNTEATAEKTTVNYRSTIEATILAVVIGVLCLFRHFDALIFGTLAAVILGAAAGLLGPPAAISSLRRGYVVIQQSSEIGFLVIAAGTLSG